MASIHKKNTSPELTVRKTLREMGFKGYRIHRKGLPGTPDIVFISRKKAILIHGCFWHGHACKTGSRRPKSNTEYWIQKIERNKKRDAANISTLQLLGWEVLTIWECELNDRHLLEERLQVFLRTASHGAQQDGDGPKGGVISQCDIGGAPPIP